MGKIKESDLYLPIRDFLTQQGYIVRGEVKDCDIVAVKDDELIIIELKLSINVSLLIQATDRQKASDSVYVAVVHPGNKGIRTKKWRQLCHLLKKLELGLILVKMQENKSKKECIKEQRREACVELIFHPQPFERKKKKVARLNVLKEIDARSGDYNIGGVNKQKLITGYREACIYIACCLLTHGSLSPAQLRKMGASKHTTSILSKNFYGWFNRESRGIYSLSLQGNQDIDSYPELKAYYMDKAKKII